MAGSNGTVLFGFSAGFLTGGVGWKLGPSPRAVDCRDQNSAVEIFSGGSACGHVPDDMGCNPPLSSWTQVVGSCDGLPASRDCKCYDDFCVYSDHAVQVERVMLRATSSANIDEEAADRLCVPIS